MSLHVPIPARTEPATHLEREVAAALTALGAAYVEQVWIGERYQVDFLLPRLRVVVEAMGCSVHSHWRCRQIGQSLDLARIARDEQREHFLLNRCGMRAVIPIWACDVKRYGALEAVRRSLIGAGLLLKEATP